MKVGKMGDEAWDESDLGSQSGGYTTSRLS